jgi:hypothetical protein
VAFLVESQTLLTEYQGWYTFLSRKSEGGMNSCRSLGSIRKIVSAAESVSPIVQRSSGLTAKEKPNALIPPGLRKKISRAPWMRAPSSVSAGKMTETEETEYGTLGLYYLSVCV